MAGRQTERRREKERERGVRNIYSLAIQIKILFYVRIVAAADVGPNWIFVRRVHLQWYFLKFINIYREMVVGVVFFFVLGCVKKFSCHYYCIGKETPFLCWPKNLWMNWMSLVLAWGHPNNLMEVSFFLEFKNSNKWIKEFENYSKSYWKTS